VTPADICQVAVNLGRNCGYATFPCREDKRPACPHGFKQAASDQAAILELWRRHPGPLIGVATGAVSGFDALDVDLKHDAALAWWGGHEARIPATRTYRTRSGGLHLYFRHADGLGCSAGKVAPGIDVRADGGYVIFWFAAESGECLEHEPPTTWPVWLLADLQQPRPAPAPAQAARGAPGGAPDDRAIDGALRLISTAAGGERNAVLHWAACRMGEHVRAGRITGSSAEALLVAAAIGAGLPEKEARATARSGLRRAS
jgi:hypothetical protein